MRILYGKYRSYMMLKRQLADTKNSLLEAFPRKDGLYRDEEAKILVTSCTRKVNRVGGARVKKEVHFCTRKLNRLRMKVKMLANSSIRKVNRLAFKELSIAYHGKILGVKLS